MLKKQQTVLALGLLIPALLGGCSSEPKSAHAETSASQQTASKTQTKSETTKPTESSKSSATFAFPSEAASSTLQSDGLRLVKNPTDVLVIVNKQRKLPDGFVPPKLRVPNVHFSFTVTANSDQATKDKQKMQDVAATALEEMFDAADKQGIKLYAVSGYRSYERQVEIYNQNVKTKGKAGADAVSARPGTSEHQTGLAMDISSQSAHFDLEPAFGDTREGKWVAAHAYEFGFVLHYEQDKTKITGYTYEPWHVRYVGKEAAAYLHKNGLTLEEAMEVSSKN